MKSVYSKLPKEERDKWFLFSNKKDIPLLTLIFYGHKINFNRFATCMTNYVAYTQSKLVEFDYWVPTEGLSRAQSLRRKFIIWYHNKFINYTL